MLEEKCEMESNLMYRVKIALELLGLNTVQKIKIRLILYRGIHPT